jgi:hypothetical protein
VAASPLPVMEDADFLKFPTLLSVPMASVALITPPAEPLAGRPLRAACCGSFSASDLPEVPADTPHGSSMLASKARGGTDASHGCHGGETLSRGQRFVQARPTRQGPSWSTSFVSFFATAPDLLLFLFHCSTSHPAAFVPRARTMVPRG